MRASALLVSVALCLVGGCGRDSGGGTKAAGTGGSGGQGGSSGAQGDGGSGAQGGLGGSGGQSGGPSSAGGGPGSGGSSGAGALPACPAFSDGVALAAVKENDITEASGIVESRKTAGVYFIHNDSGDSARIFAVGKDGAALGTFSLTGAGAVDWEDLAAGPGPDPNESYLYAGDIGDNPSSRPNVKVYRVPEPKVDPLAPSGAVALAGVETFTLKYPDGAHNAETLLVDPLSGDLFIVVKAGNGVSPVFRAKAPLSSSAPITLEATVTLTFGEGALTGGAQTTGGDISKAGDLVAIRTYASAFVWRRMPGASVVDALGTPPCTIPLHAEPQGEALGFARDGSGYVTVSEGVGQPLYFFAKQ